MSMRIRRNTSVVVAATGLAFGRLASAQGLPSDSIILKAAAMEASGNADGAHAVLQAARGVAKSKDLRDQYRAVLAGSLIGENRLAEAERELGAIASDPAGNSSPTSRTVAFAKALLAAFRDDRQRAETARMSLAAAFGNEGLPLAPRAMLFVVSGAVDSATATLAEIDNTPVPGVTNEQFTAGFRGLLALRGGDCEAARLAVERAPVQQGSLIQAVKARCAQRQGKSDLAAALRDSVLRRSPSEMYQWPAIIARNTASSRPN